MRDLEDDLRADGAAWREQVDRLRPDLAPPLRSVQRSLQRSARPRAWIGGLVAAALVLGLAVAVVTLRHTDLSGHHTVAGADAGSAKSAPSASAPSASAPSSPSSPALPRNRVICPTGHGGRSSGSGFSRSLARSQGAPTIEAAAAKFAPKHVHWTIAARDANSAVLLYRAHYLHLVRLPGGGWAVDSGGECGNTNATVAR